MSQDLNGSLTPAATLSGNINTENILTGSFGTSFGSADYNDLTNKPSINSVELTGNKTTLDLGIVIPTKTSDLTNDSGFITDNNLATVATTGNYNDLNHKPNLATVATSGDYDDLTNKPDLAEVATTGSYLSLSNKPTIPAAQVNSDWNAASGVAKILNKPTLATVATSGDYDDLTNKPNIPAAQVNSDWNASSGVAEILNKPSLATVATTGDYNDLLNKPAIPAAQVNSDWNASSGVAEILNKPSLATVATTGSYNDLSDKPDLTTKMDKANPTGTGTLTMTGNGVFSGGLKINGSDNVKGVTRFALHKNSSKTVTVSKDNTAVSFFAFVTGSTGALNSFLLYVAGYATASRCIIAELAKPTVPPAFSITATDTTDTIFTFTNSSTTVDATVALIPIFDNKFTIT